MLAAFVVLVFTGTFVVAAIAVVVARLVIERRNGHAAAEDTAAGDLDSSFLFKSEVLSSISLWHSILTQFDFVKKMKTRIAEADLNWSVGRVTLTMLLSASATLALLMNISWVPGWAAIAGCAVAGALPYMHILRKRTSRFRKIQQQFPDMLDTLGRSMAAGHPYSTALEMVVRDSEAPVSTELRRMLEERKLGMNWDQALSNLTERVPLVEVSLFAAAVRLQSRTGGKLNEVLGRLAETMRESVSLEGEVRAIAAHGKLTGAVLSSMPLFIVAIMTAVNPGYFLVLLRHPHGKDMIAVAILCLLLAHVVIRRIVDIKI